MKISFFKIEIPTVFNTKIENRTSYQFDKLLKSIDEDNDIQSANFMRMVLYTGMRRGEIFRLKWEHINLERGFIFPFAWSKTFAFQAKSFTMRKVKRLYLLMGGKNHERRISPRIPYGL